VYFGTNPSPGAGEYRGDVGVGEWLIDEALVWDTEYYWQVIAKNDCGSVTSGPVWSFTYGGEALTVTDPGGSTVWLAGEAECVAWTTGPSHCTGLVDITLYKGAVKVEDLVLDTANDGIECGITVPSVESGTDYRVLVATDGVDCLDWSAYFEIQTTPPESGTPSSSE
jgi:hypothetical protein